MQRIKAKFPGTADKALHDLSPLACLSSFISWHMSPSHLMFQQHRPAWDSMQTACCSMSPHLFPGCTRCLECSFLHLSSCPHLLLVLQNSPQRLSSPAPFPPGAHYLVVLTLVGLPGGTSGKKNSPVDARAAGSIPRLGRSLGGGNATHSSILACKIPWTEEPGGCKVSDMTEHAHTRHNLSCCLIAHRPTGASVSPLPSMESAQHVPSPC